MTCKSMSRCPLNISKTARYLLGDGGGVDKVQVQAIGKPEYAGGDFVEGNAFATAILQG